MATKVEALEIRGDEKASMFLPHEQVCWQGGSCLCPAQETVDQRQLPCPPPPFPTLKVAGPYLVPTFLCTKRPARPIDCASFCCLISLSASQCPPPILPPSWTPPPPGPVLQFHITGEIAKTTAGAFSWWIPGGQRLAVGNGSQWQSWEGRKKTALKRTPGPGRWFMGFTGVYYSMCFMCPAFVG